MTIEAAPTERAPSPPTPERIIPGFEYAEVTIYPFAKNKIAVLNSGDKNYKNLAVPFKLRGGDQRGRNGRQLAIGTDPNDPHRLMIPEDVRPYDGIKDDRRNKTPNKAGNVVVLEGIGRELFDITGQAKFKKLPRGAEITLGPETVTVIGYDPDKNEVILYKGKLNYQTVPDMVVPEIDQAKNKVGGPSYTALKDKYLHVMLKRKLPPPPPPPTPPKPPVEKIPEPPPPPRIVGEKPKPAKRDYPPYSPRILPEQHQRYVPKPVLKKPAWGPLTHVPGVDKPGYPKFNTPGESLGKKIRRNIAKMGPPIMIGLGKLKGDPYLTEDIIPDELRKKEPIEIVRPAPPFTPPMPEIVIPQLRSERPLPAPPAIPETPVVEKQPDIDLVTHTYPEPGGNLNGHIEYEYLKLKEPKLAKMQDETGKPIPPDNPTLMAARQKWLSTPLREYEQFFERYRQSIIDHNSPGVLRRNTNIAQDEFTQPQFKSLPPQKVLADVQLTLAQ